MNVSIRRQRAEKPTTAESTDDLEQLSWNELRTLAARSGAYGFGMTKAQVLSALRAA